MFYTATYGADRHKGDQYLGVFHKYSLGGDTTTPSGLYARLCHAFLVYVCDALIVKISPCVSILHNPKNKVKKVI